jgi:putative ABC transport system substrate-binding protein
MTGKYLALLLTTFFLVTVSMAEAQQPGKTPRIGYLSSCFGEREEAFRKDLRELGYTEGQNIVIEWRFTEAKRDRQAPMATELVRLKVDCIVTAGTAVYAFLTDNHGNIGGSLRGDDVGARPIVR